MLRTLIGAAGRAVNTVPHATHRGSKAPTNPSLWAVLALTIALVLLVIAIPAAYGLLILHAVVSLCVRLYKRMPLSAGQQTRSALAKGRHRKDNPLDGPPGRIELRRDLRAEERRNARLFHVLRDEERYAAQAIVDDPGGESYILARVEDCRRDLIDSDFRVRDMQRQILKSSRRGTARRGARARQAN